MEHLSLWTPVKKAPSVCDTLDALFGLDRAATNDRACPALCAGRKMAASTPSTSSLKWPTAPRRQNLAGRAHSIGAMVSLGKKHLRFMQKTSRICQGSPWCLSASQLPMAPPWTDRRPIRSAASSQKKAKGAWEAKNFSGEAPITTGQNLWYEPPYVLLETMVRNRSRALPGVHLSFGTAPQRPLTRRPHHERILPH